jgi:hypothetical protein
VHFVHMLHAVGAGPEVFSPPPQWRQAVHTLRLGYNVTLTQSGCEDELAAVVGLTVTVAAKERQDGRPGGAMIVAMTGKLGDTMPSIHAELHADQ